MSELIWVGRLHLEKMASNISRSFIPVFSEDKRYDTWLKETKAWVLTTSIEKKNQALSIALALPEGSEVRRRVFDEWGDLEELKVDDGVDKLILRLDKWYKEDDISAQYNTWRKLITYERKHGISMESYISEFTRRNTGSPHSTNCSLHE